MLGVAHTANQVRYDLTRLRLNGLIERRPGTDTYDLTADGRRVAIFYTEVRDRLLGPFIAANTPLTPPPPQAALTTIDRRIRGYVSHARLSNTA
jgi:predicted MarR family transcription regulator